VIFKKFGEYILNEPKKTQKKMFIHTDDQMHMQ